jgi:DNA-binding response OmpR family regulator
VATAYNGKEGLKKAKLEKPDVILLDIMMPKMDGFAVLKALKKEMKTMYIPVIMLTAVGDEPSKLKAAAMYDEKYLTKPIENEALEASIKECLEIRGIDY